MKAIITVTRKTTYTSIVEMPQEKYDQLRAALDGDRAQCKAAEKLLNAKIDVRDWQDDELLDVEEFAQFVETP